MSSCFTEISLYEFLILSDNRPRFLLQLQARTCPRTSPCVLVHNSDTWTRVRRVFTTTLALPINNQIRLLTYVLILKRSISVTDCHTDSRTHRWSDIVTIRIGYICACNSRCHVHWSRELTALAIPFLRSFAFPCPFVFGLSVHKLAGGLTVGCSLYWALRGFSSNTPMNTALCCSV